MGITENPQAVTGAELKAASDEDLRRIVPDCDIFARTSPEHKLRLVQASQANDEVVAMTGDGMNDAPALKRADVGIAMGIKGTEATKKAAKIVLADDNFASIERAVEEGRTIYDNLQKAILFILPTNGAQSLVILVAVLLGLDLPLSPVQILWANMVTAIDLVPGVGLRALRTGFDASATSTSGRADTGRACSVANHLCSGRLIGGATIAVFLFEEHNGYSMEMAQTMAADPSAWTGVLLVQ